MMIWLTKTESPRQEQKSYDQEGKTKKEGSEIMSEARDRKMKRERRFEMQKAEKVLRACRSRRGYELFQEPEKKKPK
jgi:hypothetical protein